MSSNTKLHPCLDKGIRQLVGTYEVSYSYKNQPDYRPLEIKVWKCPDCHFPFLAVADCSLRTKSGWLKDVGGIGDTELNSISNLFHRLDEDIKSCYPNDIDIPVFIFTEAMRIDEESNHNARYPLIENGWDWRTGKVTRNAKGGAYFEFQIEQDGQYSHWKAGSVFLGMLLIDSLLPMFNDAPLKLNYYGVTTYSKTHQTILRERIEDWRTRLQKVSCLSDYIESFGNISEDFLQPDTDIWRELSLAQIDFLKELDSLLAEAINENKVVFALGI